MMLTRRINAIMSHSKLWQHCTLSCKIAFIKQMRGIQYGRDELVDAFDWFVQGWRASDIARLKDTCSQVNTDGPGQVQAPDIFG
jgi:hypothetical protein